MTEKESSTMLLHPTARSAAAFRGSFLGAAGEQRLAEIKQNGRTEMNTWLYQMALRKEWSPEDYRVEVWEGQDVTWPSGKVTSAEADKVIPGDVVFLFFTETRNVSPGVYGVGIITRYSPRRREITFRVCPPSDHLKTDPLWNNNVKQVISHIRGRFSQGTMWRIPSSDLERIQSSVRQRMGSS